MASDESRRISVLLSPGSLTKEGKIKTWVMTIDGHMYSGLWTKKLALDTIGAYMELSGDRRRAVKTGDTHQYDGTED